MDTVEKISEEMLSPDPFWSLWFIAVYSVSGTRRKVDLQFQLAKNYYSKIRDRSLKCIYIYKRICYYIAANITIPKMDELHEKLEIIRPVWVSLMVMMGYV